MKCSACENNECEGKYEHRDKCVGEQEGIECTCICRITHNEAILSSAISIGTGVAVTAAGIGLTVATGGIAAIIAGAAIAGSGTSLVFSPIQKYMSKECVTLKESAKEVAIGATIGGITGPIGAIGSIASKGASAAVQIGARILAGSSTGAVTGVLSEGAKAMQGEEVTIKSLTHSAVVGAAVGTIGGASTQIALGVTKPLTNEIGRAATRIAVQGSSTAVTDAGVQLIQNGTVNPQKLILNTTGKMVLATTAEVSTSVTKQIEVKIADSHNKKHSIVKREKRHVETYPKDTKLKGDQATAKRQDIKVSDPDLQDNIKPYNLKNIKQQQDVQLPQNLNTNVDASESFDQKLKGMFTGFSSQLQSSYDRLAGHKNPVNDSKDEEQEKEENQMQGIPSEESVCNMKGDSNDSTDLPGIDSNQHDDSNSSENMDIASNDESTPLLVNIDYDLLIEAQNPDEEIVPGQSDVLLPIEATETLDNLPIEPPNNLDLETQESPEPSTSRLTRKPSTSKIDPITSHDSENNELSHDLEKLSSLVSKVIASMEVPSKENSPNNSQSLSTNNSDSRTRVDNSEDKEAGDMSYNVLESSSSNKQTNFINQNINENDNSSKPDKTIIEHPLDASNPLEEHQLSEEIKGDLDNRDGTASEETQNKENSLRKRATADSNLTNSKCDENSTITSKSQFLGKRVELESRDVATFYPLVIDSGIILTVLVIILILIVLRFTQVFTNPEQI
ncbi:dentin sialophosphoprotein-like [Chironomus tepperi]|uniref:dentin sialophosphoprotein-like n=1 Tax=Chironomus tepperi TaxID=113505 RepID=UPI00391FAF7A